MTSRFVSFYFRQRIPRSRGAVVPKTSCSTARGKHEEAQKRAPNTSLDFSHSLLGTSVSHQRRQLEFLQELHNFCKQDWSHWTAAGQHTITWFKPAKVRLYFRLCFDFLFRGTFDYLCNVQSFNCIFLSLGVLHSLYEENIQDSLSQGLLSL